MSLLCFNSRRPSPVPSPLQQLHGMCIAIVYSVLLLCVLRADGATVERIYPTRTMLGGKSCQQEHIHCDRAHALHETNTSLLYRKQGLMHCNHRNYQVRPCSEYYISEKQTEYAPEFTPPTPPANTDADNFHAQSSSADQTVPAPVYFSVPLIQHYLSLMKDVDHSIHRINRNVQYAVKPPAYMRADIVIDVRCYHSWTVNPFHRHADCMTFLLPALYMYLESGDFEKQSQVLAEFREARNNGVPPRHLQTQLLFNDSTVTATDSSSSNNNQNNNRMHIMFLADESSDHVCRALQFQKSCAFNLHSLLESKFGKDMLSYSCVSTSNYFASPNWFRHKAHVSVVARVRCGVASADVLTFIY
jgi:hypothetical protein